MGDFILVLKTSERPTPVATSAAVLEMTAPPPTTTLPTDSHAELEALRIAFAHAGAPDDLAAAPSVLSSLAPEPLALIVEAMAWLVESHRTVDEQLQRANFATKRAQRESVRLQTERDEWKERFIAQDRKQAAVESKLKKATQEFKAERTALRAKVERLTKGGRKLEHLVNQYRATIRRKEGDYARLQDRLSKLFKQKHVAAARGLQVNAERSAATTVADATGAAGEPLTKATAVSKTTRRRRPSTSSSKAGGASGLASSRRPSLRKGGAKAMRAAAAEKVAAKAAPALESTPAAAATAEAALHAEARLATEAHRVAAAAETATLRAALQALGAPADAELQGWAATRASRWAAHCLEEEGQTAQAQNSLPPKPPTAGPLSSNEAEAQALVVQQLERRLAAATRTQDTAAMEVQRVRAQMAKLKRARAATAKRTHSAASDASDAKLRRDNDELRELVAQHKSLLHASLAGGLPGAASSAVAPLVATASSAQALPPSTPRCVEALRFGGDSPSASARDEVAIERVQLRAMRAELELERSMVAEQSAALDMEQMKIDNDRFILKQTMMRLQQTQGGNLSLESLVPLTPARIGTAEEQETEGDEGRFEMPVVATPPSTATRPSTTTQLRIAATPMTAALLGKLGFSNQAPAKTPCAMSSLSPLQCSPAVSASEAGDDEDFENWLENA